MSEQFQNVVNAAVDTVATDRGLTAGYYTAHLDAAKATIGEAVSEKVAQVVESLRATAESNYLSQSVVENAFIEAGLVDPEPEPEPEVEAEPETLEQKVDRLLVQQGEQGAAIAALIAAAKANGINPDNYAA